MDRWTTDRGPRGGWRSSPGILWRAMGPVAGSVLSSEEAASTLFRFFRSRHLADVQVIFRMARLLLLVSVPVVLIIAAIAAFEQFYEPCPDGGAQCGSHHAARAVHYFLNNLGYLGTIATLCGAAIAWAYQTGSARLGVVDLFAGEISTLCRVGTIFDIGKRYVDQFQSPPAEGAAAADGVRASGAAGFVSSEDYFPVFQSNARDLQVLEASVVNNITEFYTYMKALRDAQRRLATLAPPRAAAPPPDHDDEPDPWRGALINAIYLLYLSYESARKAVDDLVEFDPTRAEHKIVILITELKCYPFLLRRFGVENIRRQRLALREVQYLREVPRLYFEVMAHSDDETEWLPAKRSAATLAERYREAFGRALELGA